MSSFTQMVSRVQSLVGNHTLATDSVVGSLVNDQHRELLESYEWARKKSEIILSTVADKTAGTVTLTNNSAAITGSSTAWASGDTGKYILVGDHLYVFTYASSTSGTLSDLKGNSVTFQGDTITGQSYVLFKRWYSLGSGIHSILSVSLDIPITEWPQEVLDEVDPLRETTGSVPTRFSRGPYDMSSNSDIARIEFYPRPSTSIDVQVKVLLGHTDLSGSQQPIVPASSIQWFAARDACLFLHAKTKEPKWLALQSQYEKSGMAALENDKKTDSRNFGVQQQIRDSNGGVGLASTDFGIYHDMGVVR